MAAAPTSRQVFLNVPFDPSYERLFVTLIGTLVFLGQDPHTVLEVREQGDGRLKRIFDLMRRCRMSIHDLSRVGLPVRFNMPFELGLACALQLDHPGRYETLVMEAKERRADRTLSDYKGRDPLIHNGSSSGMIACLLDTFETGIPDAPAEFRRATRLLRESAAEMKHELRAKSFFRPSLVRSLISAATRVAVDRQFIER